MLLPLLVQQESEHALIWSARRPSAQCWDGGIGTGDGGYVFHHNDDDSLGTGIEDSIFSWRPECPPSPALVPGAVQLGDGSHKECDDYRGESGPGILFSLTNGTTSWDTIFNR